MSNWVSYADTAIVTLGTKLSHRQAYRHLYGTHNTMTS